MKKNVNRELELLKYENKFYKDLIDKLTKSEMKFDSINKLGSCDCKEPASYIHSRVIYNFSKITLQTSTICENCLKEKKYIEEMDRALEAVNAKIN